MTAAALLVVLGAALFMQWGGLSMAMGAFLAGVLLSESTFRHQLEADIEPFRGILLGLFFLGGRHVARPRRRRRRVAAGRGRRRGLHGRQGARRSTAWRALFRADHREAVQRAALFAQGGEFAFVLYAAALAAGVFDARAAARDRPRSSSFRWRSPRSSCCCSSG